MTWPLVSLATLGLSAFPMLPPFDTALAAPLNHLLAKNPWARQRLTPFAGKTVVFKIFPIAYRVAVTANGDVETAPQERAVDVSFALTPPLLLRILAGDEAAQNEVLVEGDTAFAQEIAYLARNLRWDIEEDLSKVFGDVIAHRLGETARSLDTWRREAGQNLAENFRDYWVEERPLIASKREVEDFNRRIDALRDDVERLEKKIERLEEKS